MKVLDRNSLFSYIDTEGNEVVISDVLKALDVTSEAQVNADKWERYNGLKQALLFMYPPVCLSHHQRVRDAEHEKYERRVEEMKSRWSGYRGKEEDRRILLVYAGEGRDIWVYVLVVYDDHTECYHHRLREFKNQRGGGDAHADGVMDMLKPLCMRDPVGFLIKNSPHA